MNGIPTKLSKSDDQTLAAMSFAFDSVIMLRNDLFEFQISTISHLFFLPIARL